MLIRGAVGAGFALATLFGFDLMPRIRNFKDLIFSGPAST